MDNNKTLKIQSQIRQNADELSSYLSDLRKWERKHSDTKDNTSNIGKKQNLPIRSSGTVHVQSSVQLKPADAHTYDKGYQKWEKFNVEEALLEEEEPVVPSEESRIQAQTPASIVQIKTPTILPPVPRARGVSTNTDLELVERERGNLEFCQGNFAAAVKCYTKCLGLKAGNFTAFTNRAMAFLKLKDYHRAESDASCALSIIGSSQLTPILTHAKALSRRASARNALGKHRAALQDLSRAQQLQPNSKEIRAEIQNTKEILRNAVNRAPLILVPFSWD